MTYHQRLYKKNMTVVRMLIRIGKVGISYCGDGFKFKAERHRGKRHKGTKAQRYRGTKGLNRSTVFKAPQGIRFFIHEICGSGCSLNI